MFCYIHIPTYILIWIVSDSANPVSFREEEKYLIAFVFEKNKTAVVQKCFIQYRD